MSHPESTLTVSTLTPSLMLLWTALSWLAPPQLPDFPEHVSGVPHFGVSVADVGDIDGDGVSDVLVGAPGTINNSTGHAYVLSGANGHVIRTFSGDQSGDCFGISVSGLGDIDKDGYNDIIVGAFSWNKHIKSDANGYAKVFSGKTGDVIFSIQGPTTKPQFGWRVLGIPDLNGDGYPDFAVSAPAVSTTLAGTVTVFSGKTGQELYTLREPSGKGSFGYSIAVAGDINQDGSPDLIVGAPACNKTGYVNVYSGANGTLIRTINGAQTGEQFGYAVSAGADLSGDAIPDIVVCAPNSGPPPGGCVRGFSGATGSQIFQLEPPAGESIGNSIATVGDLNGDGVSEVLVGNPDQSMARIYSVSNGVTLLGSFGPPDSWVKRFGSAVCAVRCANANSCVKYYVSADWGAQTESGMPVGRVWMLSGGHGTMVQSFEIPGY